MSIAAQIAGSEKRGRKAVVRKDADCQEQVFKRSELIAREAHLIEAYRQAHEASEQFSADIKATAEKCGLNAAAVRRYIAAKASEDYDEAKRKVEQLALAFDI
jgi:hypothetical protein